MIKLIAYQKANIKYEKVLSIWRAIEDITRAGTGGFYSIKSER